MKGFKLPTYSKPSTPTDRASVIASIPKPRVGGYLSGQYEGMGMGEECGGTRSKAKPSKKEKNPYGRTRTSEMSLGKMKKVKKPAQAPPPADQPDVGLALDLPPPPPAGRGKGRRAPAGPNDGRRKRAEIVKKVMAEQGLKMIEASRFVKAHNLY